MTRNRKLSKKIAAAFMVVTMFVATSTTAFAYVDPAAVESTTDNGAKTSGTVADQKDGTDEQKVLEESKNTAFSTAGNAQVQDDITDGSTKEFYTITTKNNNTFYLVIDRSSSNENVYMLSQIDENDLQEFLDSSTETNSSSVEPSVVLEENQEENEESGPEIGKKETKAEEKQSSENIAGLLVILILVAGGAGAYYYFKIRKKKNKEEDDDSEGLEFGDGLETVDESQEEDKEK